MSRKKRQRARARKKKTVAKKKLTRQVKRAASDGNISAKEVRKIKNLKKKSGSKLSIKKTVKETVSTRSKKGRSTTVGKGAAKGLKINKKGLKKINNTKPKEKPKGRKPDPDDPTDTTKPTDETVDPTNETVDPTDETVEPEEPEEEIEEIEEIPEGELGEYDKNTLYQGGKLQEYADDMAKWYRKNQPLFKENFAQRMQIEKFRGRGKDFDKSLAGKYLKAEEKGKGAKRDFMKSLRKPLDSFIDKSMKSGNKHYNTFTKSGDDVSFKIPSRKDRVSNAFRDPITAAAKNLGASTSPGDTMKRIKSASNANPGNKKDLFGYKQSGAKQLGINVPTPKDIRDDMPEMPKAPVTKKGRYDRKVYGRRGRRMNIKSAETAIPKVTLKSNDS